MSTKSELPNAVYRRFDGMREYEATMDELIAKTQRVIRVFDRSLAPAYDAPLRYERLRTFLRGSPGNRLFLVVHDDASIVRLPRLALLLQQFSRTAQVRVTPASARHIYDPFVIFDASHYLHRFHYDHVRAAGGLNEPDGVQQLLERFGELWDASTPARSASVMGL
jgi:hypothetical protein